MRSRRIAVTCGEARRSRVRAGFVHARLASTWILDRPGHDAERAELARELSMKLLRLAPENTKIQLHAVPPRELSAVGRALDHRRRAVLRRRHEFRHRLRRRHAGRTARQERHGRSRRRCAPRPTRSASAPVEAQRFGADSDVDVARRRAARRRGGAAGGGRQSCASAFDERLRVPQRRGGRPARLGRTGADRHARRRRRDPRGADLSVVPLRMAVRGRRDHRHDARSAADGRLLLPSRSSSSTRPRSPRFSPSSAIRSTRPSSCSTAFAR